MKISMHAMSHDVFKKALTQLLVVMEKGVANAKTRNFDPNIFVTQRLAPDMLPFSKQIQLATTPPMMSLVQFTRVMTTWPSCCTSAGTAGLSRLPAW